MILQDLVEKADDWDLKETCGKSQLFVECQKEDKWEMVSSWRDFSGTMTVTNQSLVDVI